MTKIKQVGVVQNFPITADFSKNLRSIVQGYRTCIDQGADLVVTSAYALCGMGGEDLLLRGAYLEQTEHALLALSHEINCAPLLVAAYTSELSEEEEIELLTQHDAEYSDHKMKSRLALFLLEDGSITQLDEAELIEHAELRFSVELGQEESISDLSGLDFILRLTTEAWYAGSNKKLEESRSWEAQMNETSIICVNAVGTADGYVYSGGSCAFNARGGLISRLALFREDAQIIRLNGRATDRPLPKQEELLRQALLLSIKNTCALAGLRGVCVAMNQAHAPLLLLLAAEALGRENVLAISYQGENAFVNQLGIKTRSIELGDIPYHIGEQVDLGERHLLPLHQRIQACINTGIAEKNHLMMLSSLNRQELVLGNFTLYAESCANLLPLGSLYEIDIYLLSQHLSSDYPHYFSELNIPTRPELDRIIHETIDKNQGSSDLLGKHAEQFEEKDVRFVQRRSISSASKRKQLAPIVHTEPRGEVYHYPIYHRLND